MHANDFVVILFLLNSLSIMHPRELELYESTRSWSSRIETAFDLIFVSGRPHLCFSRIYHLQLETPFVVKMSMQVDPQLDPLALRLSGRPRTTDTAKALKASLKENAKAG